MLEVGLSGAGSVLPFGDADFFGDTVTILQQTMVEFHGEPVGLVATPSGQGYWEVYSDGGVFGFGDAGFFGSTGGIHLNKPIVGMAATPSGTAIGWSHRTAACSRSATRSSSDRRAPST